MAYLSELTFLESRKFKGESAMAASLPSLMKGKLLYPWNLPSMHVCQMAVGPIAYTQWWKRDLVNPCKFLG